MTINKRKRSAAHMIPILLSIVYCSPVFAADTSASASAEVQLDKISSAIQDTLTSMNNDLSTAAQTLAHAGLDGDNAHVVLSDLCDKHRSAVDCCTIDARGKIVAVEPPTYQEIEGKDVSNQHQVADLIRTKKPVLSKPFKAVEGFYAIDMEWPVLSAKGELLGSVSMIVRPISFIDGIVTPQFKGNKSDVWVMQPDGQIIYSRYRENVGDNPLATPSYISGPTLASLVKQIASQPEGVGHYNTPPVGGFDPMARRCVWKTISINETQWRVVVFGKLRDD